MNAPTRYPPQKGVWTLIAPDGRKWEGSSGLDVAAKEQRERIPASVAIERIYRAMDDESPRMETRLNTEGEVGLAADVGPGGGASASASGETHAPELSACETCGDANCTGCLTGLNRESAL